MNYELLNELLAERGMSRRKLAILAGINPSQMSMWFSRRTEKVPSKYIAAISKTLGVNPAELLSVEFPEWKKPKLVLHQKQCETRPLAFQMFGFCPACRQQLSKQEHPCYCGFCGQAVKWDG